MIKDYKPTIEIEEIRKRIKQTSLEDLSNANFRGFRGEWNSELYHEGEKGYTEISLIGSRGTIRLDSEEHQDILLTKAALEYVTDSELIEI